MQKVRRTTPEGATDYCGFFSKEKPSYLFLELPTQNEKTYVISFYLFNDTGATKNVTLAGGTNATKTASAAARTWNYISIPFVANGEVITLNFEPGSYYIYKVQLEEGTTSTPWTSRQAGGLDFPHGFPFDYSTAVSSDYIINNAQTASNAILTIYGPAESPAITIGENTYKVNDTFVENEYLTIDTKQKTVTKTTRNGEKINLFSKRDKENYIFEKIQPGQNTVVMTPKANYTITLIDERSEPKWT